MLAKPSWSLRALNLKLPPRTLILLTLVGPENNLVMAAYLPFSKARFFLCTGMRPPVALLLCLLSLEIPILKKDLN
jgi:hypothetical protein